MIEKMKVVHIVTTSAEKTALLDRLQQLGIVHFSEKASAARQQLLLLLSSFSRKSERLLNRWDATTPIKNI